MTSPDPRITVEHVRAAIAASTGRTIWSPSTTLEAMGIDRWPHEDKQPYHRMKRVLAELEAEGFLVRRPRLHGHYTLHEVAYEHPRD